MKNTQTTAVIYLRKSSVDERSGGKGSIFEQEHECLDAAEREGLTIVKASKLRRGRASTVLVATISAGHGSPPNREDRAMTIVHDCRHVAGCSAATGWSGPAR